MPRWLAPILIAAVAVALHLTVGRLFGAYAERVAMDAGIAVVLAVSLNIVNGYTGQFSIGHAAFFALGAYAAGATTYYGSLLIWDSPVAMGLLHSQSLIFIAATLVGGLVAAGAGWLIGLPSLRLKGDYLAIVTLGFGEILRVLLQQTNRQLYTRADLQSATWGQLLPPPVGGSLGFINVPKVTNLFWVGLFTGLTLLVAWRLKKSTFGRSMIAIRENEIAAESMGVNVTRLKVWAFVFAAFFAGVAGSLYAHEVQITPLDAGFQRSFDIVIMVVLGGLGSISGTALAAVLVVVAGEWLRDPTHVWHVAGAIAIVRILFWPDGRLRAAIWWTAFIAIVEGIRYAAGRSDVDLGEYRMIIFSLVLILTMILRPGGLMGLHEITDSFRQRSAIRRRTTRNHAAVPA